MCFMVMGVIQISIKYFCFFVLIGKVNASTKCIGSSSTGETFFYCCDNYVDVNGTCVECENGYISENGTLCKLCPTGTYGRKCANDCHCGPNQRCDNVVGCIYELSTSFEVTTVHNKSDHLESTKQKSLTISFVESSSTTFFARSKTTELPILTSSSGNTGLHIREIVIYCIAVGSLTFIVLFCSLLLRRYKQNNLTTNNAVILQRRLLIQANMQLPQVPDDTTVHEVRSHIHEAIYETIHESEITNIATVSIDDISGDSSDIDSESPQSGVGYLNPYQSMVEDVQKHEYMYCDASGISDDSNSYCSNGKTEGSSYLNPYQKIATAQNRHEYTALQSSSNCFMLFNSEVEKAQTGSRKPENGNKEFVLMKDIVDCSKRRCHSNDVKANKGIVTNPCEYQQSSSCSALNGSNLLVDKIRRHSN